MFAFEMWHWPLRLAKNLVPAFYVFLLLLLNTFLYAECELSQTDREAGREGQPVRPYPFDAVDISPEKNTKPKWQMALPRPGCPFVRRFEFKMCLVDSRWSMKPCEFLKFQLRIKIQIEMRFPFENFVNLLWYFCLPSPFFWLDRGVVNTLADLQLKQ